jgi:oligopeptide/dipeptide ABC transporter ATP-binding protein
MANVGVDQMSPILEVEQLRVSYRSPAGAVTAIRDVSLVVREGEAVGLVGESGSGKSSLGRAVLGMLPEQIGKIDSGRILIGGRDVTQSGPRQWRALRGSPVAVVFQDPLSFLNPVMRIFPQIAESIRLHDPGAHVPARVAELLELVRLPPHVARSFPHELSGGMRQRVLLAIALGCRPRLLIADEPTTALDVTTQSEILLLLAELRERLGMALLLISHDLAVVAASCTRAYVMYDGYSIEGGEIAALFARPGHPYTKALLAAASATRDASGRFVTIERDKPHVSTSAGCPFQPCCPLAIACCGEQMPAPLPVGGLHDHLARCWCLA